MLCFITGIWIAHSRFFRYLNDVHRCGEIRRLFRTITKFNLLLPSENLRLDSDLLYMLVFVTKYLILRFSQVIMLVCTLGAHAEPEPQKYHSSYAAEYPPTHYSKPYSEPAYESYPEKYPAVYHEKYPTTYPEKYPAPYHEKYHASYPEKYPSYPEKYPAAYPEKYPAAYPEKYPTAYQPKPTVYPYSTPIKYCDPKAAPKCAENTTNTVCLTDDEYPTYEIKVTQSVFFYQYQCFNYYTEIYRLDN